jgi:hypothetical protein
MVHLYHFDPTTVEESARLRSFLGHLRLVEGLLLHTLYELSELLIFDNVIHYVRNAVPSLDEGT